MHSNPVAHVPFDDHCPALDHADGKPPVNVSFDRVEVHDVEDERRALRDGDSNFVRQALAGEPLIVHGSGAQTRSFTWVGDVVRALLALVAEPRSIGQVFNIGNGEEVSIQDLAQRITTITASRSPIEYVPYDTVFGLNFEDMSRRVPDISKIQQLVGYTPRVQLDEILERVVEFWLPQQPAAAPRMTLVPSVKRELVSAVA